MIKSTDSATMYLAPGASGYASVVLPGASQSELPPVDDYAVEPETRQELIDGRIVHVAPAHPAHADRHSQLDYVLRASVAPGYVASTDMLTRTSARWNFAADASIRKQGIDPATGSRYLEELAVEIKHTQSLKALAARAQQLVGRGARRVFVLCVKTRRRGKTESLEAGPVLEWSASEDRWVELAADAMIEDPCLRCPVPVRALVDATEADKAVARALLARGNPVLEAVQQEIAARAEAQGEARGYELGSIQALHRALVALCEVLAIELTPARRARIEALDAAGLSALLDHLRANRRWDE